MKKLLFALLGLCLLAPAARAQMVNAQTGSTYTFANTDCDPQGRKVVTFNNQSGTAVTLAQAGNGSFQGGCIIQALNVGLAGAVTITPTTSTINNQAALIIPPGGSAWITEDATAAATGNYWALLGAGGGGVANNTPRNLLDNGAMNIVQRAVGTATTACGGTSGTTALTYTADRWACLANVGSQAGDFKVATSSPTPPTGFAKELVVWRASGALTQPVCTIQEVPTLDSTSLQGQTATLSFYAQALAGLSADNGNVINAYIMTGTGTDQGLATLTASPAITPAWTGIAATITKSYTLSASTWSRYSLTGTIPTAGTEIAVAICFTPTATGAGSTDGFAVTGVQLEAGSQPSAFEYRSQTAELTKDQAYFWQITDPAATVTIPSTCNVTTANTTVKCAVTLPVSMRAVPTASVLTATSFGIWLTAGTAGTCTTLAAASSASTVNAIGLTCTTGGTIALGTGTGLIGAAVSNATLSASADF
jgi:hypothetical protein